MTAEARSIDSRGFDLAGAKIGGSVSVTGNSGAGPLPSQQYPIFRADTVGGSLACSKNTPTLDVLGDKVGGSASGQCALPGTSVTVAVSPTSGTSAVNQAVTYTATVLAGPGGRGADGNRGVYRRWDGDRRMCRRHSDRRSGRIRKGGGLVHCHLHRLRVPLGQRGVRRKHQVRGLGQRGARSRRGVHLTALTRSGGGHFGPLTAGCCPGFTRLGWVGRSPPQRLRV